MYERQQQMQVELTVSLKFYKTLMSNYKKKLSVFYIQWKLFIKNWIDKTTKITTDRSKFRKLKHMQSKKQKPFAVL